MLKKVTHIILTSYLLVTLIGFTVTKHYCANEMEKTQICTMDECGCDMSSGMCELKMEYVHLAADFIIENTNDNIDIQTLDINVSMILQDITSSKLQLTTPQIELPINIVDVGKRLALLQIFRC